ncbi:hypothetical protein PCIT_b1079 [Pseudoalteromonas citrea]|uniref:Uncharacterized protein n=1 Tax=Pseudoalteromonas citrea TaxID=43655 RepID=A0AAD4AFG2_9GAMM|nr:hypothetical protein PCIT_b1079 [Pseudoalteromonas citrea]
MGYLFLLVCSELCSRTEGNGETQYIYHRWNTTLYFQRRL